MQKKPRGENENSELGRRKTLPRSLGRERGDTLKKLLEGQMRRG